MACLYFGTALVDDAVARHSFAAAGKQERAGRMDVFRSALYGQGRMRATVSIPIDNHDRSAIKIVGHVRPDSERRLTNIWRGITTRTAEQSRKYPARCHATGRGDRRGEKGRDASQTGIDGDSRSRPSIAIRYALVRRAIPQRSATRPTQRIRRPPTRQPHPLRLLWRQRSSRSHLPWRQPGCHSSRGQRC